MKKQRFARIMAVILAVIMVVPLFAACKETPKDNEKDQLVVAIDEPDGVFNSFFATSGNDTEVAGRVSASMIDLDKNANIVYGADHPTVALDYMSKIVYDPDNPSSTTVVDNVTYTDYYYVLKNKVKFSDGKPLTIKDVLFTYYVYLDKSYIGSSTMYSTDIIGLDAYRSQTEDKDLQEEFDRQMIMAAYERRNTLIDAFQEIKKNDYNDNLVMHSLRDEISYVEDNKTGSRTYTLVSAMRDKIKENYPAQETNPDNPSATRPLNLAADYEFVARTFYEELETDYSNNIDAWDTDELRDRITNNTQMFLYAVGFIEEERVGDSWRPIKSHPYVDWTDADKEKALQLVFEDYMPVKFEEIILGWATASTTINQFRAEAVSYYYSMNKGNVPNISGITWNKQWVEKTNLDENMIPDSDIYDVENHTITITQADGSTVTYPLAKYDNDGNLTSGYEVLKVRINKVDPKAIFNFAVTPMPMHIYSPAVGANWNGFNHFGVDFGSVEFMSNMRKDVTIPVGAGAYQASNENGTKTQSTGLEYKEFYDKTSVYFVRNDYFYTLFSGYDSTTGQDVYRKRDMSITNDFAYMNCSEEDAKSNNAAIRKFHYYVINSSKMYSTIKSKTIHLANPTAKTDTVNELETDKNVRKYLGYARVDNVGYGYIGINAGKEGLESVYVRRAIAHAIDLDLIMNYYPGGMAQKIFRGISRTSWAYPVDETEPYYLYDGTGEMSRECLDAAAGENYLTKSGDKYLYEGKPLKLTFTIAGDTQDHPAYQTLYNASLILQRLGIEVTVKTDVSALKKLATGSLQVWAAAWSAGVDPDMYQVYHMDSVATSVYNWGYREILDERNRDLFFNEYNWLVELSEKIDEAREILDIESRKRLYFEAQDMVMNLCVEIPTYQRKEMFVYNKTVIDESTLLLDTSDSSPRQITPYQSPHSRIWEVSFVGN